MKRIRRKEISSIEIKYRLLFLFFFFFFYNYRKYDASEMIHLLSKRTISSKSRKLIRPIRSWSRETREVKSKRKRPRRLGRDEDRGAIQRKGNRDEERSMGEIKTNDRLGERPRSWLRRIENGSFAQNISLGP